VTDGGLPIDLYDCDGSASVERGEATVGSGINLNQAWDDFLHGVSLAPVDEADLAAMWKEYDKTERAGSPARNERKN
jgi:hypothetical protein